MYRGGGQRGKIEAIYLCLQTETGPVNWWWEERGNSMRQPRSNTGDEVHDSTRWEMSGVRKREQCAVIGSYVWGRSVESLKKVGWGEGFDLGCDNDKRPGEMGYGDHSNTCPALHELHSTQTRCGRGERSVPAQEGGDHSTATATSPFVV